MKKSIYAAVLFLLGLFVCHLSHAQNPGKPRIHQFIFEDGATIHKLSDNGAWAVACGPSADDATMDLYPKLIHIATDEVKELCDDPMVPECAAYDVTDDGNMVVGTYNGKPGVWLRAKGEWQNLPLPEGWSSGCIQAVTPDGKYAVGRGSLSYTETPVLWDLENDGEIIPTPGYPEKSLSGERNDQVRFIDITADGRYILGITSFSYVGYTIFFVYDRNNATFIPLGFNYDSATERYTAREKGILFIDDASISPDGKYVNGTAYMVKEIDGQEFPDEYRTPYSYNMETDEFTLFDEEESHDMTICATDNTNALYAAAPPTSPVRTMYIRSGKYWIPLHQILQQVYGIDYFAQTGFEYTGTPISASADGLAIGVIAAPSKDNYILTLPELLTTTASGINLLSDYQVSPVQNTSFSKITSLKLTFSRNVKTLKNPADIQLQDENGKTVKTGIQFEVDASNPKIINIRFRAQTLADGKKYTVVIPAGALSIAGDETRKCDEIRISYIGRATNPVKMTEVSPAAESAISQINFTTNPVIITFDTDIALTDTASAVLFRNDEKEPFCELQMLASDKRIAIYPTTTQYLFKDNTYRIEIKKGSVTDLAGNDANELLCINYNGAYVREITSDDKVLFSEDFNLGLTNMLLYDGDQSAPNTEMAGWDFTSVMPWGLACDEDNMNERCATSHSMYVPAGKSDDWMVTPQIYIPDGKCEITFRVQSYRANKEDKLKVIVWPGEKVLNALAADDIALMRAEGTVVYEEIESPGANEDVLAGDWVRRHISLEKYAGKNIYVAFVNENEDQSAIFVDDLQILRNQDFIISLSSATTAINQASETIKGHVVVKSESKTFSDITLTLKDGNGNVVETLTTDGLSLKKDDSYPFEFSKALPLEAGKSNRFMVSVQMGESKDSIITAIKNLCFEPTKRITVEEYTGMGCPNCPAGIVAMENLEKVYGDKLIPIVYHTYTGDIYESGLTAYTTYLGLVAAPSSLVNRLATGYPLGVVNGGYAYYSPDGDSWLDVAEKEMEQYADADVNITASYHTSTKKITVPCTFKYALDASNLNVNLLTFITEDKLIGYQDNNYYNYEADEVIKDWCKGGIYGKTRVAPYTFNDVARAYVGDSYLGYSGYVPAEVTANKEYTANIVFDVPSTVKDINNCHAVCMMIDANTGKYINAARAEIEVIDDGTDIKESHTNSPIIVNSVNGGIDVCTSTAATVTVYSINGSVLATSVCNGKNHIGLNGYQGIALVRITQGNASVIKKVIVK